MGPPGGDRYLTFYSTQTAGLHQDAAVVAITERHLCIIVALVVAASLADPRRLSKEEMRGRGLLLSSFSASFWLSLGSFR